MASLSVPVVLLANLVLAAVAMTLEVNGTVGGSVVLPCDLNTSTDPTRLRFHWQDREKIPSVLYSFNQGQEMSIHQGKSYHNRTTVSVQDIRSGIISVKLNNLTLGEHRRFFWAYVVLFDENGARQQLDQICQTTLNVAVPYESPNVIINEEMTTAVCTTHGGFPEPWVTWKVQELSNNSFHFLRPEDADTAAVPDPQVPVYRINSIIDISGQKYRSVTCLIHNPTSNVTLSYTVDLSGSEQGIHVWVAVAAVLVGTLILVVVCCCRKRRGSATISGSGDALSGSESSEVNISNGNAQTTFFPVKGGIPRNCVASGPNADAAAGTPGDAEEQKKLLNNSVDFGKENGEIGTAGKHEQGQSDGL